MILLLLLAIAVRSAAQGVCQSPGSTLCVGYAPPLTTYPLFTLDSLNRTYFIQELSTQCPVCAARWVLTSVIENGEQYAAYRCPFCCSEYAECIAASARLGAGDVAAQWGLPVPSYSWLNAAQPLAPSACSVWLLGSSR